MRKPALLAVLAALVLVGTTEPAVAKRGDETSFSSLVHIGNGRTMYMECIGTGSPTVVLVSGFRGAHDDWTHVIDHANPGGDPMPSKSAVFFRVSKFARVCAYDRPGTTDFGRAHTWPAWLAAQEGVATLLDARHVTRTNSGHFIQGAAEARGQGNPERHRGRVQRVHGSPLRASTSQEEPSVRPAQAREMHPAM